MTNGSGIRYDLSESALVGVSAAELYALVSDIARFGDWSPECVDGEWTTGEPGALGSRFLGHNRVGERTWTTGCEVLAAEPSRRFAWSVRTAAPAPDTSVWSFEIEPLASGCRLTQRYVLHGLTDGLRKHAEALPAATAEEFFAAREQALREGMQQTIAGIKDAAERTAGD